MDTVCHKNRVHDSISCLSQIAKGSASVFESNTLRTREDTTSTDRRKKSMLDKHAIESVSSCHPKGGYYSRLFLVHKKSGGWRPIIDLSLLNQHVIIPHFKMETLDFVRLSLWMQDCAISIDFTNVHFHI